MNANARRWVALVVTVSGLAIGRAALAADDLVGSWEHKAANGASLVLTFEADGSGKMNEVVMKWSAKDGKLSISAGPDTNTYTYRLDGDTLVVSGGDLEAPTSFARKSAPGKTGLGGQLKEAPTVKTEKKTIVGAWKGQDGSVFEVAEDSVKLGPNRFPAVVGPDSVTVTGANGTKVVWPYKLDGDALEITVGTEKQRWTRIAPAAAEAPKPAAPAAKGLVGKWRAPDGTEIEFKADGSFLYGGQTLGYKAANGVIAINGNEWKYSVDGDTLTLTLPDAPPTKLVRAAAANEAKPATDEGAKDATVVGAWDSKEGLTILRADGTGRGKDGDFTWSIEKIDGKTMLKFVQNGKWLAFPYTVDKEKLVLGSGPSVTLTRAGLAGVWVGEEATLDPQNYLSYTQYLILYKDGSIGYAKSEGYASRRQVTENWERFYSGGESSAEKKSVGTWKKDGPNTLSITLNGRAQPLRARYDLEKWVLRVDGMGVLPGNEGGALDFKRK